MTADYTLSTTVAEKSLGKDAHLALLDDANKVTQVYSLDKVDKVTYAKVSVEADKLYAVRVNVNKPATVGSAGEFGINLMKEDASSTIEYTVSGPKLTAKDVASNLSVSLSTKAPEKEAQSTIEF
eukprot:Platyproteum_vivax@DN7689_c5_g2_i2.p1